MFQKTNTTVYTVKVHQISEIRWNYITLNESLYDIVNKHLPLKFYPNVTWIQSNLSKDKTDQVMV